MTDIIQTGSFRAALDAGLRATVSQRTLLLAMPRLTLPDFHGAMARSYGGLRLKHLDGKK